MSTYQIRQYYIKILLGFGKEGNNRMERLGFRMGQKNGSIGSQKNPTSVGSQKRQEKSKKTSTSFGTKAFDCVYHNKLWKILKEMGIPDHLHLICLLQRFSYREICMQVKKQHLELDMEQWSGSKLGKEYIKAVYCHPAYLTYMQSTS